MIDKKDREKIAGNYFIEKYNKKYNKSWILEDEGKRIERQKYQPFPDLIFYDDGDIVKEVEEVSLWDNSDIEAKKQVEEKGIGRGSIRGIEQSYYHNLIKEKILKKNYKCDTLLINSYHNNWDWDLELKGFDVFSQNDLELQNHFKSFYKEVWLLDGDKNIYKIYGRFKN